MRNQVIDTEVFHDHIEEGLHNLYGVIDACKIKRKYISILGKPEIPDISTFETINDLAE